MVKNNIEMKNQKEFTKQDVQNSLFEISTGLGNSLKVVDGDGHAFYAVNKNTGECCRITVTEK